MLFNVTSYNTASDINSQFHVTMLLFVGELAMDLVYLEKWYQFLQYVIHNQNSFFLRLSRFDFMVSI